MESVYQLTRTQLIAAQKKYYQDMIDNPGHFVQELDGSEEQAADTIDHLLTFID